MSRNEKEEKKLLRLIHQDLQQLLEKRFLNSLDTSLALLVPIVAVLLGILRFYEVFTDPKILNLTMVGIFLTLFVPILLNIVSIISDKLILRVCSWSSLSIILTNWLYLITADHIQLWMKSTELLALHALGLAAQFLLGLPTLLFNVMITLKLMSSISTHIPSRSSEMKRLSAQKWIVYFHAFIVVCLFVLFQFVV